MSMPLNPDPSLIQRVMQMREDEKARRGMPPGEMPLDQFNQMDTGVQGPQAAMSDAAMRQLQAEGPPPNLLDPQAQDPNQLAQPQMGQPGMGGFDGSQLPDASPQMSTQGDMQAKQLQAPPNEVHPAAKQTMIKYGLVQMYLDKAKNGG